MENQRKTVADTPSPTPTPAQPKSGQMHNFKFPADLKWGKNTSNANLFRGRRQGESSSSSVPAQKQRPPTPALGAPARSAVLKYMLVQNPLAASGTSASGSSSRYPSPSTVSDKESNVVDVLRSGFLLDKGKGENEERGNVKNERFSMTLPSPEKMVDQFKKGLAISEGREEKKLKKVNIRKKKSERAKVEEEPISRIDEEKELVKEDLEVPWTKRDEPLAREVKEKLSKIDDNGEDEDMQLITGELGESERVPWNLRPRKSNQRPKVPKPIEAVGSSSNLGGKSVPQRKCKIPAAIGHDTSDTKKAKEKDKKGGEKREKGKDKGREKGNNMPITPNFSLTLTPEEIAEDLFAMTGRKPSRKLKKREKAVQETLDQLFPGMQLKDITPNDYKTSDNPRKGD